MPRSSRDISTEALLNDRMPAIAGYVASDQSFDGVATTYFGFVDRQGNWYIQKQVVSGNDISWRYAKGTVDYSASWTGRTALSYNLYSVEF